MAVNVYSTSVTTDNISRCLEKDEDHVDFLPKVKSYSRNIFFAGMICLPG